MMLQTTPSFWVFLSVSHSESKRQRRRLVQFDKKKKCRPQAESVMAIGKAHEPEQDYRVGWPVVPVAWDWGVSWDLRFSALKLGWSQANQSSWAPFLTLAGQSKEGFLGVECGRWMAQYDSFITLYDFPIYRTHPTWSTLSKTRIF